MEHANELARSLNTLKSLSGQTLPVVDLHCSGPDEAPLFARIVSKLSPLLGNVFEDRLTSILNAAATPGYQWIRQDPEFPDALLLHGGKSTDVGFEIKAWYVHSTEITGRFRESVNLLAPRDVHVVLVAWNMDRIIHGQARILGVHVTPAIDLASTRDRKYHQPPTYLCVEPENTADRTRNLRQSNVNGYRLQRATDSELAEAKAFADSSRQAFLNGSHTPQASQATREMMRKWNYRLDTNFAKIERIHEPTIEAFTDEMQGEVLNGGLTVAEWTATLRNLTSDDPAKVAAAEVRTAPLF